MLLLMDAFQEAVNEARRHLSAVEGREVSAAELIRRTNLPESRKRSVAHHLNPNRVRKGGHHVPADFVNALADVLMIPRERLADAAQAAAGFQRETTVSAGGEHLDAIARFLGDPDADPQERDRIEERMLELVLEMRRRRRRET